MRHSPLFIRLLSLWIVALMAGVKRAMAAEGGMPQLDISTFPGQIFWLVVTFGGLYIFFGGHLIPALSRIVDGRQDRIRQDLEESEQKTRAAHQEKESYERALNEARAEASALVQAMEQGIRDSVAQAQAHFQERSAKEITVAVRRIDKAKKDALADVQRAIADCVTLSAEKIAALKVDPSQAQSVIDTLSVRSRAA